MESMSGTLLILENLLPGSQIDIETRSRHYQMRYLGGNKVQVSGHPDYCPEPVQASFGGSFTSEGSLEPGLLGRGMRVLFYLNGNRPVTTSAVQHVRVERATQAPQDSSLN